MIIEYAQILSTAHRVLDGEEYTDCTGKRKVKKWGLKNKELENIIYKSTHINHPCCVWVIQSVLNYCWLYQLFIDLCAPTAPPRSGDEYTFRFDKKHLTDSKLRNVLKTIPQNIPKKMTFTTFPKAFPNKYNKTKGVVQCYTRFYRKEKKADKNGNLMNIWTRRTKLF